MGDWRDDKILTRAAKRGYAPAQGEVAAILDDDHSVERCFLLEKAAAQNDRNALYDLVRFWLLQGNGKEKAIDLLRRAAELNHRRAQFEYGFAFGPTD
jgi:hypothetical protein